MDTIYDKSSSGKDNSFKNKKKISGDKPEDSLPNELLRSQQPCLPQVSRPELIRHYTNLSSTNFGVDVGFYPLGSCTMKYNPKIHERLAGLDQFQYGHPLQDQSLSQGNLELMYKLGKLLQRLGGMDEITLQPAAGAHEELTGMLMIHKYFLDRGEDQRRKEILLPDSSHGTNPASASLAGFDAVEIPSNQMGRVDLDALRANTGPETAGIMLTVPNTLGLFERNILEIADVVHESGGLCYFDGANMNAFLGRVRPGDMGMDIVHYNLHKTFSTPHGGGGPGAGPVAVTQELAPYLPVPLVEKQDQYYSLNWDRPHSIGKMGNFYGNFSVLVRAYAYLRSLGEKGLKEVSGNAVLNANYLREKVNKDFPLPYGTSCKHEFVVSGKDLGEKVRTIDVAKRLLDYGFHPPTVYFPLIVEEALMIEPTETESKETLDRFAEALGSIVREARENPELLHQAPTETPVKRLDEAKAAKEPKLTWAS